MAAFTPDEYVSRDHASLHALNDVNRRSGFTRSIDDEGALWIEHIGFYPIDCPFPEGTFDTLMGGFVHNVAESLKTLQSLSGSSESA